MKKRALFLWMGLVLATPGVGLLAQQPPVGEAGQEIVVPQELQAKIADRYEANAKTFYAFLSALKKAIEEDNPKVVASMIHYPIKAGVHGKPRRITTSRQLASLYPKIFTKDYKALVLKDFSDLTLLSKGVMLGDGSMWINTDEKNARWQVIAINNF